MPIRRSAYLSQRVRLSERDLRSVIGVLDESCEVDGPEAFSLEFLERLRDLVHAQAVTFCWMDRRRRIFIDGASTGADDPDLDAVFWDVSHSCPSANHHERTGSCETVRFSDLISRREYRRLPIYREYFHPYGVEEAIVTAFPPVGRTIRYFIFWRALGERDFSDRDRSVLEQLRPHLGRMHDVARLGARVGHDSDTHASGLTAREQEIITLVAEGSTNAEIARLLWVAPSTVKKHLENVYAKLEVPSRAAAVARVRAQL